MVGGLLASYLPTYLVFFRQVERRFHNGNRITNHSIQKWVPLHYHTIVLRSSWNARRTTTIGILQVMFVCFAQTKQDLIAKEPKQKTQVNQRHAFKPCKQNKSPILT
jgi:hypothetical protein